jgi:hypothetical protein
MNHEESKNCINRMSERETVVELPFAADCCPCVEAENRVTIQCGIIELDGG